MFTTQYHFTFVSEEHEEFFKAAIHEIGSTYPPTVAAVYLLSACAETRERFWQIMDLDGGISSDPWECWKDEDSRRCYALAVNLTCGGYHPVLSPAYLYDTPLAPILWAATEFWYHNRGIA